MLSKIAGQNNLVLAGIDLSPDMISVAQEKLGGVADLRVGDAEELPWPDNSFDVVLCLDAFHHCPHPRRVLAEISRVAGPNGQLFLADYCETGLRRQIMNLSLLFWGWGNGTVRFRSKRMICKLLKSTGFARIKWELVTRNAYLATAIAVKPKVSLDR